jgi:hypothetical protein
VVPASRAPTVRPVGEIQVKTDPFQVNISPPLHTGAEIPMEILPPKATVAPTLSPFVVPIEIVELASLALLIEVLLIPMVAAEAS